MIIRWGYVNKPVLRVLVKGVVRVVVKTINDFSLEGKVVLLRSDLNSDLDKKKVVPNERILEAAKTIKKLKLMKAKVVILAHQGNPGKKDFISLRQHHRILNKFTHVDFVDAVCSPKAVAKIKRLENGQALLLENVRFVDDEFHPLKKDNKLLTILAPLSYLFVNDAFSVSHRDHTSITGFPRVMKNVCVGPLVEKELSALEKISLKDCLYILGGAKPESDIVLLRGNKVLACGLFGQLCLVASGKNLGFQNDFLKKETLITGSYESFLKKLKSKLKGVITPVDFAVEKYHSRRELPLSEFPNDFQINDVGKLTVALFTKEIMSAKSIYMKGPAGLSHDRRFSFGTVEILSAISRSKAFSVIGGGHLSDAIDKYHINKRSFNHISLSGGASLSFIAGEKLPGLKILGYYKK